MVAVPVLPWTTAPAIGACQLGEIPLPALLPRRCPQVSGITHPEGEHGLHGAPERDSMATFADLGVRSRTADALRRSAITEPLPVQRDAIPVLLARRDVVMEA